MYYHLPSQQSCVLVYYFCYFADQDLQLREVKNIPPGPTVTWLWTRTTQFPGPTTRSWRTVKFRTKAASGPGAAGSSVLAPLPTSPRHREKTPAPFRRHHMLWLPVCLALEGQAASSETKRGQGLQCGRPFWAGGSRKEGLWGPSRSLG